MNKIIPTTINITSLPEKPSSNALLPLIFSLLKLMAFCTDNSGIKVALAIANQKRLRPTSYDPTRNKPLPINKSPIYAVANQPGE